jgi:hypothetical protein
MNTISAFLLEIVITIAISALTFRYLKYFLNRVLIDLCGTEDRAQFWTVFSGIVLIGLPLLFGLLHQPQAQEAEGLFFEITRHISSNLIAFMFALVGIGLIVSFFALVAPRVKESK